jgi:PAS domain S-box-containing protein
MATITEALPASQADFRGLFEDAPIAYHEIDRHGIIVRVNRTECTLLGYDAAEMLGRAVWEFVSLEMQPRSREAVRKKLAGEQELKPFCRDYARRDGSRVIVEVHEALIRDRCGEVAGIRTAMIDVTERERIQRELALRTAELARSNAELEQFAYVASHDLQEPLRKIMTFGDRLRVKCAPSLDEQGRDYLERMRNAAGRMQVLINDLLTLSRIKTRAHPFARVDLGEVLDGVLADLEVRIEKTGARIEAGRLPSIDADSQQISQLFQNLIANAIKFTRPGEPPAIRIDSEFGAVEEQVSDTKVRDYCRITVADNGIGFDEKYVDRIFQVFQRLHGRNEYEGTGVGLAICRQIAERHGGSITAHSAPGEGARFIVTLPVEQPIKEPVNDAARETHHDPVRG